MSDHASTHDSHAHVGHHVTPISQLIKTALWLTVLMATTIIWAQIAPAMMGNTPFASVVNNLVALGIASLKAFAVIQVFMGVKYQTNVVKTYAILGFVWMTLMFTMFADYGTRQWEAVRGWTPEDKETALPRAPQPYETSMPERNAPEILAIPEAKH